MALGRRAQRESPCSPEVLALYLRERPVLAVQARRKLIPFPCEDICSSVEMSAIRYGRSDYPALRGHGRPGLWFSRFVVETLCPGHRLDCAGQREWTVQACCAGRLGCVEARRVWVKWRVCACSPSPETTSAPSPASPTTASWRGSGCPAPSPNSLRAGFKAGPVPAVAPRWLMAGHTVSAPAQHVTARVR